MQEPILLRDPRTDARMLSSRLEHYRSRIPVRGPTPIERESQQPAWPGAAAVPEIAADRLTVADLRSAMATSGSLLVRGLLAPSEIRSYKGIIDRVLADCAAPREETTYRNPPDALPTLISAQELAFSRSFLGNSGAALCVESSSVAEQLLELYERRGIKQLLTGYLGETPCLSALKWVLRRSQLPINPAGWHQDGAFMGPGINSLNMWIPLSACGGDTGAPGLDVLPVRLRELVSAGTEDAVFSWSVGDEVLTQRFGEGAIASPVFQPGDAYFFDHFFLHRTQFRESFPRVRYAIETWFFGSENFPKNQIPLAW